ncbi:Ig-like domain-containing protein [Tautonia sp. JC769]|uniref:Ig-like domain-containing protein n=1 Tax=Tautonia sp. JC769 TaxID=3232135 RepID=UPI003458E879
MRGTMATVALGVALLWGSAYAQEITLDAVPPVVVETVPKAGSGDVDPSLAAIRVTFSKDMQDGSWSWSTLSKETFPETTGSPKYLEDERTAALPVRLEAGKTYAIWINSQRFRNFKDAKGQPAVPYLLVFKTRE